jgi:hypothetical protein
MKSLPCKQWKIGDHYIDCGYIPRVVIDIDYERLYPAATTVHNLKYRYRKLKQSGLTGRSLIDCTIGSCSIRYCKPEKVHSGIAKRWAKTGPLCDKLKDSLEKFYASDWGAGRKIWWSKQ